MRAIRLGEPRERLSRRQAARAILAMATTTWIAAIAAGCTAFSCAFTPRSTP